MQTKRLGRSPIVVSKICMGTMTFGNQADEATSFRILDKAFDAGINFFDAAENYPVPPDEKWAGRTEEILGRWMKGKSRDAIIMATKVCGPSHGWIRGAQRSGMTALDRHNITRALEASLRRLNTDYIDLYQTHWPDHGARYEDALETLDDLVRAGKIRIIGCSNETTWGLMKSLATSERDGFARYETIQNNFSLNPPLRGRVGAGLPQGGDQPDPVLAARRRRAVWQVQWRQAAGGRAFQQLPQNGRPSGDDGAAVRQRQDPGLDRALRHDRRGGRDLRGHPGHGVEQAA
ncbi:putative oxidoreductase, NADP(H)-dependent aldo-keto reductase [Bradyrhizobium oligotrophicum S58]|uniref:Putative oxidoreductase, NADP(H)-dependent aldo-keto reductase n=1 Tax=Bradyrhizobium oligotrophicum S58 TaxID=1245469 RepID=M4Z5Z3_9BRAD|nr:putative oxidoreductase, NADP(H)-dependent aldo-keto reductase [Bradyrhizobium oligotrophicum S58]